MTTVPDAAAVATYLGEGWDSDSVQPALDAELAAQQAVCRTDPYNASLAEALKRRVARNLAMKNVPLGVQVAEFGATRLGTQDPEVRRLEAPYRRLVVG